MISKRSLTLMAMAFVVALVPQHALADGNSELENLNSWMVVQAGYFGCEEAALKGVIVQRLGAKKYEVAATTLGDEVEPVHVILNTSKTEFTSKGEIVICVNKKYKSQKVKTKDGFADTWMVVAEGKLDDVGIQASKMGMGPHGLGAVRPEESGPSSAPPDDQLGPKHLKAAHKAYAEGNRSAAKAALRKAQKFGYNDLDLASALEKR